MSTWQNQFAGQTKQARRTFFSFHYMPDNQRAQVVKQSWLTKQDREAAGFFDSSAFETKRRTSEDALKDFLSEQLKGTTVTCALIGAETAFRPWVRYELVRSFQRGNGLFGIHVHGIRGFDRVPGTPGPNPFEYLAYRVFNDNVYWYELNNGGWSLYEKVPALPLSDAAYDFGGRDYHTFAMLFPVYDWANHNGYENLGAWVERAAQQAGK